MRARVVPTSGPVVERLSPALRLDTAAVATFAQPAANSSVGGTTRVVLEPVPDDDDVRDITSANVCVANICGRIYAPAADGSWQTTIDTSQVPSGAHTLQATVEFARGDGITRSRTIEEPLAYDNDRPTVSATLAPGSGDAPLAAALKLDVADLQGGDLQYSIQWGDGTANMTGTLAEPYTPSSVGHSYAAAGNYVGQVTVRDAQGHSVSQSFRAVVTTPPNRRPTASLTVDQARGPAPQSVQLTAGGSDPDGDPLTYRLEFGDGAAQTGALPIAAPISHVYSTPGTRRARLLVSDGTATASASVTVTTKLAGPLAADAGDAIVAAPGADVTLDGSGSSPSVGIERYHWEFGDGTAAADGATVTHRFVAAGDYTVKLTVSADGEQQSATTTVHVVAPPPDRALTVHVHDSVGALAGADALVVLPDGSRVSASSDGAGSAVLRNLADGTVKVYVSKDGYLPQAVTATINAGVGSADVTLAAGAVASAELTSRPMTRTEIISAGIDPDDPQNQHVYAFEANLAAVLGLPGGSGGSAGVRLTGYASAGGWWDAQINDHDCDGFVCSYGGVTAVFKPGKVPMLQWLVLPGKASFLKEFFSVQMLVQNLASPDFTLASGQASLTLPAGLSLAPTATPQTATRTLPDIPGGGEASTSWVVRGDTEGSYDLTAAYRGRLQPVDEAVEIDATTQTPLKVWGGSALKMTIDTDDAVVNGTPMRVRVGLTNKADVPVYNAAVELTDDGASNAILQPREQRIQGTDTIEPGKTFWTRYYVFLPHVQGDRHVDVSRSFVRQVGGDVSLESTIMTHPAASPVPQIASKTRDGKVILDWETVPGATDYRVYSTPDRDTPFGDTPLATTALSVVEPGHMKVAFTPPSADAVYAVSPVIDGHAQMVHPLISGGSEDTTAYPLIVDTGAPHDCKTTSGTTTFTVSDPDYPVVAARYATVAGATESTEPAATDYQTPSAAGDSTTRFRVPYTVPTNGLRIFVQARDGGQAADRWTTYAGDDRYLQCRYIAFGDSYTSGEGITPEAGLRYDCGTDLHGGMYYTGTTHLRLLPETVVSRTWGTADCQTATRSTQEPPGWLARPVAWYENLCHRSPRAYPNQIRTALGFAPAEYQFLACSGARTYNVGFTQDLEPQYPNSPPGVAGGKLQIDTVADSFKSRPPTLVTIGMGGNDAGFGDIIKTCLDDCLHKPGFTQGIMDNIHGVVFLRLRKVFQGLRSKFPDSTVIAFGYPSIIGDPSLACASTGLGTKRVQAEELLWLRDQVIPAINDAVKQAASEAGVVYADITDSTRGGELCSEGGGRYINGLRGGDDAVGGTVGNESFHPNQAGHDAIAKYFLENFTDGHGHLTVGRVAPTPESPASSNPAIYLGNIAASAFSDCGSGCLQPVACTVGCLLSVAGDGFAPGSLVKVVAHSEPVTLGSLLVDDAGHINGAFTLPSEVSAGDHELTIEGVAPSGALQTATTFFTVQPLPPAPGGADTGSDGGGTTGETPDDSHPGTSNGGGSAPSGGQSSGGPSGSGGGTPLTTTVPAVRGLKLTPSSARLGKGKKATKVLAIGFSLSTAATVTVAFDTVGKGLLRAGTCVKASAKLRKVKAKACTRYVAAGQLPATALPAGPATLSVPQLKVGGKRLKAGTYRVRVTAAVGSASSVAVDATLKVKAG